ncbi:hypothetical protein RFI_05590, partial [Reticulomyxa filosa]
DFPRAKKNNLFYVLFLSFVFYSPQNENRYGDPDQLNSKYIFVFCVIFKNYKINFVCVGRKKFVIKKNGIISKKKIRKRKRGGKKKEKNERKKKITKRNKKKKRKKKDNKEKNYFEILFIFYWSNDSKKTEHHIQPHRSSNANTNFIEYFVDIEVQLRLHQFQVFASSVNNHMFWRIGLMMLYSIATISISVPINQYLSAARTHCKHHSTNEASA